MTCHAYHAHSSEATSNATPASRLFQCVSPTRLAREHVAICAMIGDDMHTQLVPDPRLCVEHEGCEHLQLTRGSSRWPKLCDMLHARSSQTLLPCVLKFERMLPRWESVHPCNNAPRPCASQAFHTAGQVSVMLRAAPPWPLSAPSLSIPLMLMRRTYLCMYERGDADVFRPQSMRLAAEHRQLRRRQLPINSTPELPVLN